MIRLMLCSLCLATSLLAPASEPDAVRQFQTRCATLASEAEQRDMMAIAGREGWLFLGSELRHLSVGPFWGEHAAKVSKATKPEYADPLPAILDFHDQLKKIGVSLLLVPVPPKAVVYPEGVSEGIVGSETIIPPRVDIPHQAFYALLKTNGVKVLDLTPFFLANRFHPDGVLYCKQDSHWSGNACVLAARQIAHDLHSRQALSNPSADGLTLKSEWLTIEITGDLWKALGNAGLAKERLRVRRVGRDMAGSVEPLGSDPCSPVILLGDSHNLVFHAGDDMQAHGAGLADQLALELGFPVDLVAVRGSGATPARVNLLRRAQKDPHYWSGKKVVIWCFSAREFTESDGWRKVPITPQSGKDN